MGNSRLAVKVKRKKSPWPSQLIDNVLLTVGVKAGNAITVTGQMRDPNYNNQAIVSVFETYLAQDALGAAVLPSHLMPSGGYAIATKGNIPAGPQPPTALLVKGVLAIDATAQDFKTTQTATYRINGVQYTKAATTTLPFTAAHVVSANKFGVALVQINAAGAISTKVPLTPQAYNTAALALAALPAPDVNNVALGYIAIAAGGGGFTANTTALTGISTFVDAGDGGFQQMFALITNAAGQFDITFTEVNTGKTFYLALVMPDGSVVVSPAITF